MKLYGFAGISYNFLKNFTAEANYQWNYSEVSSYSFSPIVFYGVGKVFNIDRNSVFEGFNIFRDYTFDGFVKYENTFNDEHKLNVLLATSVFKTTGVFAGRIGRDIRDNSLAFATVDEAREQEIFMKN
jgi:hypothetical protein